MFGLGGFRVGGGQGGLKKKLRGVGGSGGGAGLGLVLM